jgi:putative ABC transport system ATP-binding protein
VDVPEAVLGSGDGAGARPLLAAHEVRKVYRTGAAEVLALRDLDLTVEEGEFVAIMGPSGSGKTTLLNCLSGLDDIDAGRVLLDGIDLHRMSGAAPHHEPGRVDGLRLPAVQPHPDDDRRQRRSSCRYSCGATAAGHEALGCQRVGLGHHRTTGHRLWVASSSGSRSPRVMQSPLIWADEPTGALDSRRPATSWICS